MYTNWNEIRWALEALDGSTDANGLPRKDWHGYGGHIARHHCEVGLGKLDPREVTDADMQEMHRLSVEMHEAYLAKVARLRANPVSDADAMGAIFAYDSSDDRSPARPAPTAEETARQEREHAYHARVRAERDADAAWEDLWG